VLLALILALLVGCMIGCACANVFNRVLGIARRVMFRTHAIVERPAPLVRPEVAVDNNPVIGNDATAAPAVAAAHVAGAQLVADIPRPPFRPPPPVPLAGGRPVSRNVARVVHDDVPFVGDVNAWPARMLYAEEAGRRAAHKLRGRAMPPATLERHVQRNRVWVVLRDGATRLPVDAAGAQASRIVTSWHECSNLVNDIAGYTRNDAVFHAFGSFAEAHAHVSAAGRGWDG